MILPFIDQTPLYNKINFSIPLTFASATGGAPPMYSGSGNYPASQDFAAITGSVIPAFICPSSPRSSNVVAPYIDDWLTKDMGATTYVGGGALDYVGFAPGGNMDDNLGAQGNFSVGAILDIEKANGVNSGGIKIAQITDGTSNTMICGESSRPNSSEWSMGKRIGALYDNVPQVGLMGDAWCDWQHSTGHFFRGIVPGGVSSQGVTAGLGSARQNGNCTINCNNKWGWYSFHTGGAHVVMADGSVRFIGQNVDRLTMARVYCFADGSVVGEF